jgi:hypothetical protein
MAIHIAASQTEDIAAIPPLFVGEYPVETIPVTVVSGAGVIAPLSVVGKITASGKYTLCDLDAVDGSEVPAFIVVDGCDATSADKTVSAYKSGSFNIDALTWHLSFDTDAKKIAAFEAGPLTVRKAGPVI